MHRAAGWPRLYDSHLHVIRGGLNYELDPPSGETSDRPTVDHGFLGFRTAGRAVG